jgi:hypothetical protein
VSGAGNGDVKNGPSNRPESPNGTFGGKYGSGGDYESGGGDGGWSRKMVLGCDSGGVDSR